MTLKERLIHFLDDIRDYERESQELICYDERDSSELVDIYLESKVNNGVLDDVIVSQNYHCYNCQSKNIKTTKYKCRDCNYEGRKG